MIGFESPSKEFSSACDFPACRFNLIELISIFFIPSFDDRAKDTLKISGAQVSPSEIESVLLSHPDKLAIDAAVAGVPSQSRSSRDEKVPRGWVVLGPRGKEIGEKAAVERLDTWVREQLSRYKWLSGGIEVVEEIPKNPTGKVLRRQLVDAFVEKEKGLRMKAKL